MHTDYTLDLLEDTTVALGNQFRTFMNVTCSSIKTCELPSDTEARERRTKRAKTQAATQEHNHEGELNEETAHSQTNPTSGIPPIDTTTMAVAADSDCMDVDPDPSHPITIAHLTAETPPHPLPLLPPAAGPSLGVSGNNASTKTVTRIQDQSKPRLVYDMDVDLVPVARLTTSPTLPLPPAPTTVVSRITRSQTKALRQPDIPIPPNASSNRKTLGRDEGGASGAHVASIPLEGTATAIGRAIGDKLKAKSKAAPPKKAAVAELDGSGNDTVGEGRTRVDKGKGKSKETGPGTLDSQPVGSEEKQPNLKGKSKAQAKSKPKPNPKSPPTSKHPMKFNLNTYKFHALYDYVDAIRRFGPTGSYSTAVVRISH